MSQRPSGRAFDCLHSVGDGDDLA